MANPTKSGVIDGTFTGSWEKLSDLCTRLGSGRQVVVAIEFFSVDNPFELRVNVSGEDAKTINYSEYDYTTQAGEAYVRPFFLGGHNIEEVEVRGTGSYKGEYLY